MKLQIKYPTKEREYISQIAYRNVYKEAELEAVRVVRSPCGRGEAANRYYYTAHFNAPDDAEFVFKGVINVSIDRRANPHFKPQKLNFVGNVWSA